MGYGQKRGGAPGGSSIVSCEVPHSRGGENDTRGGECPSPPPLKYGPAPVCMYVCMYVCMHVFVYYSIKDIPAFSVQSIQAQITANITESWNVLCMYAIIMTSLA